MTTHQRPTRFLSLIVLSFFAFLSVPANAQQDTQKAVYGRMAYYGLGPETPENAKIFLDIETDLRSKGIIQSSDAIEKYIKEMRNSGYSDQWQDAYFFHRVGRRLQSRGDDPKALVVEMRASGYSVDQMDVESYIRDKRLFTEMKISGYSENKQDIPEYVATRRAVPGNLSALIKEMRASGYSENGKDVKTYSTERDLFSEMKDSGYSASNKDVANYVTEKDAFLRMKASGYSERKADIASFVSLEKIWIESGIESSGGILPLINKMKESKFSQDPMDLEKYLAFERMKKTRYSQNRNDLNAFLDHEARGRAEGLSATQYRAKLAKEEKERLAAQQKAENERLVAQQKAEKERLIAQQKAEQEERKKAEFDPNRVCEKIAGITVTYAEDVARDVSYKLGGVSASSVEFMRTKRSATGSCCVVVDTAKGPVSCTVTDVAKSSSGKLLVRSPGGALCITFGC